MKPELTIKEIRADLAATDRDLERLRAIVENIDGFMKDCGDEDRTRFKLDLMKFETLLDQGKRLRRAIATKLAEVVK